MTDSWRYVCVKCGSVSVRYWPGVGVYDCQVCDHRSKRVYDKKNGKEVTRDERQKQRM